MTSTHTTTSSHPMTASVTMMAATSRTVVTFTFRLLLRKDGYHDDRVISWAADLEEWVRMVHGFLAFAAVVEVLENAALVADAFNGINITAVTDDACVLDLILLGSWLACIDHLSIFGGLLASHGIFLSHELDEGFFGCALELTLDQVLEGFAWDALVGVLLVSLFLGRDDWLWLLLDHLDFLDLLLYGLGSLDGSGDSLVNDELDAFVVAESAGIRHLEVRVIFDNYGFSIMVNVADSDGFLQALSLGKAAYLTLKG